MSAQHRSSALPRYFATNSGLSSAEAAVQVAQPSNEAVPQDDEPDFLKLNVIRNLETSDHFIREGAHWTIGGRRPDQTAKSFIYGALANKDSFPFLPLIYRWVGASTPKHLDTNSYNNSFETADQWRQCTGLRVPGLSMVQYLGQDLGLNGISDENPNKRSTAHTGILAALLDDLTARVSFANASGKPSFTANFQLEYLHPVPTKSFVVMDAWATKVEGRKIFITSYVADPLGGQVLVRARSLFVRAA
ncbi:hypothetical protein H4R24_001587 [Coemansia sp. RSA 988]|nr:hypothetical protein H4R24_001587 [Coemansia sp. RSA 988]